MSKSTGPGGKGDVVGSPLLEGWAMTVLGRVDVASLGHTQVHEHLHIDMRPLLSVHPYKLTSDEPLSLKTAAEARWNPGGFPDNYHQTDVEMVVEELSFFRNAGGGAIVDVTPSNLSRSPGALRTIAEQSGVQVVMGGGYYLEATHPPDLSARTAEDIAQEFVTEFRDGVADTGIRPGILGEIGTNDPMTGAEARVLRSAAWAQTSTGCR